MGQVDVMMNNSAVPADSSLEDLENWNATIAVRYDAAMLCSREVLRRSMMEGNPAPSSFLSGAGQKGMIRRATTRARAG